MTERLHFHFSLSCIGEGNGNPLQCSCLENPRDRGACWVAVSGVAQSQTRLKRLSSSSSSIHWKDWCWSWNSNTLATSCEELTHWKRPWCWERLKAGGKEDNREQYGWMASLTWWTRVWASSKSWWWTGKPGMLQSMGVTKSQTQLSNWTELNYDLLIQCSQRTEDHLKDKPSASSQGVDYFKV